MSFFLFSYSTQVGRSFFTPPGRDDHVDLTGGMELWSGCFQSAIFAWEPYLNIDGKKSYFLQLIIISDNISHVCLGFRKSLIIPPSSFKVGVSYQGKLHIPTL